MDLTKIPFTNGVDNEIKGYVDLTDIIDDAINEPKDKVCISFIGVLNEAHYKCDNCGKEEWKHNF